MWNLNSEHNFYFQHTWGSTKWKLRLMFLIWKVRDRNCSFLDAGLQKGGGTNHSRRCSFSIMVKWVNDGSLHANTLIMVNARKTWQNARQWWWNEWMMVKWVNDHILISLPLTSISPSLTSILPSLAWSKP